MIVTANNLNLKEIAACHCAAFPKSFSSALGLAYVEKMLEWYIADESAFLFYLREDDRCIGYCGGMIRSTPGMGSASSMTQYSFNQAIQSFLIRPWLIFHPELRAKYLFVLKNLWYKIIGKAKKGNESTSRNDEPSFKPYVALVVIGVRGELQGKGYGSVLLKAFEKRAIELGYFKMLLTVLSNNFKAIKSYERNGWRVTKTNEKSTSMEKIII